ncbi:hypothetical protein BU26DRAFT_519353 [Trematosphaeria pertusa]|uniref:Uncharacterized protein n=1 Tax=Trematosphaeria pertusa TaxID=390896 RepID=A0A6A6IG90_9PLEO|nr:uncharacterized protein BU26DRAFT_519353 [Trematosphaeria pertusa]KAF2249207.1 hypothetical protein BU26DRAFT_519353 [Trematosphaeria pertusa]
MHASMPESTTHPQVRFLVACPRSGSTLLVRIFAEAGNWKLTKTQPPICAATTKLSSRCS